MSFVWTQEHIAEMTDLANQGLSSSQVAMKFGTTRSAVLGKAFRLGVKFKSVETSNKPKTQNFIWNDRALNRLRELIFAGFGSAEISKKLCREFVRHISPEGVRTKASVLGLSVGGGRENQIRGWRTKGLIHLNRAQGLKAALGIDPPPAVNVVSLGITLSQLKLRSCRYPLGDPRESQFRYCGLDQRDASSYCEGHHKLCYRRSDNAENR
jgi:GcrA cell cycle regulator